MRILYFGGLVDLFYPPSQISNSILKSLNFFISSLLLHSPLSTQILTSLLLLLLYFFSTRHSSLSSQSEKHEEHPENPLFFFSFFFISSHRLYFFISSQSEKHEEVTPENRRSRGGHTLRLYFFIHLNRRSHSSSPLTGVCF